MLNLHTACSLGKVQIVIHQLKNASNINELVEGWSPLMFASYHGRKDIVSILIQNNANKLIVDKKGYTALILAAISNNIAILEAVYDEQIVNHQDENGWTALFHAVNVAFELGVIFLLEHKSNINHRDKNGCTPLMLACRNEYQNMIQILINYNANKTLVNNNKESAQDIIIKYSRRSSLLHTLQQNHIKDSNVHQHGHLNNHIVYNDKSIDPLYKLLSEINLQKYYEIFQKNKIGLHQFVQLNENDLKQIGISLLGPRRRLFMTICQLKGEEYKKD